MKIALVSEHASPLSALGGVDAGGQNVHVAALGRQLAALGHHVTVYTRRDDPCLPATVRVGDRMAVRHVTAGPPSHVPKDDLFELMPEFAGGLADIWAADPPDVVHAHFWMSGYASLAARPSDVPLLQTFHALGVVKRRHSGAEDTSPRARLAVESRLVHNCDRIIATCSDERDELISIGGNQATIDIVPCGVDTTIFRPIGPTMRRNVSHRLVTVSRLVRRKGIGETIVALADVPHTELIIVGGPSLATLRNDPEFHRLHEIAIEHGVSDRVRFVGGVSRRRVAEWMRSADAVVVAPYYEPFGIVPIEAMACGVPVIGTAVGGLLDTVVDGATGVLVPPRRPEAIAAAARRLLADDGARRRMGVSAAGRARKLYRWEKVAVRTLESYRTALSPQCAMAESS